MFLVMHCSDYARNAKIVIFVRHLTFGHCVMVKKKLLTILLIELQLGIDDVLNFVMSFVTNEG